MNLRSIFAMSITALTLTACASKPASDLYVLRVPENTLQPCKATPTLMIERPAAPAEYDNKRIAVLLDHNHLTYYTGANWASPFPDQLQDFLSDAFTQQGFHVLDDVDAATNARGVHLTIQEANVIDTNAPIVHLRMAGTLSNPSGGTKRFTVNEKIPAAENHMPQIIDAYNLAALNAVASMSHMLKARCPN